MGQFLQAWNFDAFALVNLALAAAAYLGAQRRARIRSRLRWPAWRTTCFLVGIALLTLTYLGPIAAWSHTYFWSHMTAHLVVTMAAAPLIVLGAPVALAFRASTAAHRRAIVRVLRSRTVRWLTDPAVTWVLFATVIVGAHFSAFYDWALTNHGAMIIIEQPLFLGAALLYYLPILGGNLLPTHPSAGVRLASLALMMLPEALVGAVIYFSPVVLYDAYDVPRAVGLTPLQDQQLSGALMWSLVMVIDSFWMMWVAAEWWSDEERRGRRLDREHAAATA